LKDAAPRWHPLFMRGINRFIIPLHFMNFRLTLLCFLSALLLTSQGLDAQTRIQLVKAGALEGSQSLGIKRFLNSVVFEHQGYLLYCDSAWLYDESNSVDAFGRVHIKGDTLDLWGDKLNYNGNTRVAVVDGNVKLRDKQLTLTTPSLVYNLETDIGFYNKGGKIVDADNQLTSKIGHYYAKDKQLFFKQDVVLINPDYQMDSDTLVYHTGTEIAYFFGPTVIRSEENLIYCENGWYDTRNDVSSFSRRAWFSNNKQKLSGDSLYYDRKKGIGRAFGQVVFTDTIEDVVLTGNKGLYIEPEGACLITDSALAILIDQEDSLFLHADTLQLHLDKEKKAERLIAYHDVRFFRTDVQGIADSLSYNLKDSLLRMYQDPVLWSSNYQLSASLIELMIKKGGADSLMLHDPAIIAIINDMKRFDQVKGRTMTGFFEGKKLSKIHVAGNAQSIYFLRDDKGEVIGVNKAECSNMDLIFEAEELAIVTLIKDPKEVLYREQDLKPDELLLDGFEWRGLERPRSRWQVFGIPTP
jgi:lipopolysaccharide export system protein LptA